ncbi:MAG: GNAT family N-acetyltransferase [Lachnospiraceae bacterium]|nr:GNAT family N-acetyltransferase [Lachnospiraceae bacterium]
MEMISNYMLDEKLRHMLNDLTHKTFGFDFEKWVTNGYFEGEYIPYSLTEKGRMLSNVSANMMKFMQNGEEKYYIQIGTVMTDEDYRKQGLASRLIKHVIAEYENACDGIYLFGNLDAVSFYEKMGFKTLNEYRYFVKEEFLGHDDSKEAFQPLSDMDDDVKKHYLYMVRNCVDLSSFAQTNKYGLQMFYTGEFNNVFYAKDLDCFVVYEQEDGTKLQSVLCRENVLLSEILKCIDLPNECALGFTPRKEDMDICTCEKYDGADDYRLFYIGRELESIERDRLYFPELSHA